MRLRRPGRLRRSARPDTPRPAGSRHRPHPPRGGRRRASDRAAHELAVLGVHRDRLGRRDGGPAARHRRRGPQRRHRRGADEPAAAVPGACAVRPGPRAHRTRRLRAGPMAASRRRAVPPWRRRAARPAGPARPRRRLLVDTAIVARPAPGAIPARRGGSRGGARHRRCHPVPRPRAQARAGPADRPSVARRSRRLAAGPHGRHRVRAYRPVFRGRRCRAGTGPLRLVLRRPRGGCGAAARGARRR